MTDQARIRDGSIIIDGAQISGHARIRDHAIINAGAKVDGHAVVNGGVVSGGVQVSGTAVVDKHAHILGNGKVDCGRWDRIRVTTDRTGECGHNGQERRNPIQNLMGDPLTVIDPENTQTSE